MEIKKNHTGAVISDPVYDIICYVHLLQLLLSIFKSHKYSTDREYQDCGLLTTHVSHNNQDDSQACLTITVPSFHSQGRFHDHICAGILPLVWLSILPQENKQVQDCKKNISDCHIWNCLRKNGSTNQSSVAKKLSGCDHGSQYFESNNIGNAAFEENIIFLKALTHRFISTDHFCDTL